MNDELDKSAARIGAYATLIGSICMLGGAAIWGTSGADLDLALVENNIIGYLSAANASNAALIANLSIWIVGVILIGLGATMMTYLSRKNQVASLMARYNYWIGIPIVVISYVAWLAVVVRLSAYDSSSVSAAAEVVGWFGVHADWIATVLMLGTGPFLLSRAGRYSWAPKWLRSWSYICLVAGAINIVASFLGGLPSYGFIIIPIGMGWMVASSIVLFKRT